ncbi:hypothetical protein GCM10009663_74940 [Kitasatospora arboriphila]|uniref:Uncharacterized protein n=1 Tax=Kitasatospora arboriphila TaxID=258052 RepID=A0ABP4EVC5_9ACTN
MTVSGSLGQWRQWTGLPFDRDGATEVPGAPVPVPVPVHVGLAHDRAVHVEPDVRVRTRCGRATTPDGRSRGRGSAPAR